MSKTEFHKMMNRSEKAIEKRLKAEKHQDKTLEDLEDTIIQLKREIDRLKVELKDAKAALDSRLPKVKYNAVKKPLFTDVDDEF